MSTGNQTGNPFRVIYTSQERPSFQQGARSNVQIRRHRRELWQPC